MDDHENDSLCTRESEHSRSSILQMLIDRGARTDICDGFGDTPLHKACRSDLDHKEKMELLLGLDPRQVNHQNLNGTTPLHIAARHRDKHTLPIVLKVTCLDINIQTNKKLSALHVAAHFGRLDNVKTLLKCPQMKVNLQDKNGDTAAHHARKRGHKVVLDLIRSHPLYDKSIKNKYDELAGEL